MDQYVAWFLLICPLAATIAILVRWHKVPNYAIGASIGSSVLCFFIALAVFCGAVPAPNPSCGSTPGFQVDFSMILDPLSKGMLLVVTGVGMLVHIFSYGYMEHDPSKGRFFGGLSIFMFSMTGIVLSSNLIMLFIFWEGVGFSSYLLVGFWYERESAALAANKAFVCNRLADFGFMTGILVFWFLMGTVSVEPNVLAGVYSQHAMPWMYSILDNNSVPATSAQSASVATQLGVHANPILLAIMVVGLFCGAVGKSAQFPLHVWLPDAMEGPTPVSALIHAATMVAAGVYMLCRIFCSCCNPGGAARHRLHRRIHRAARRAHRRPAKRHQTHHRLLDALATRLHGHGGRLGRPDGGDVPSDHARVFQGAAVPRRRLGHHRAAPRAGHLENGRLASRKCR